MLAALWLACGTGEPGAPERVTVGVEIRPSGGVGTADARYTLALTVPADREDEAVVSALTGLVYVAAVACPDELGAVTLDFVVRNERIAEVTSQDLDDPVCLVGQLRDREVAGVGPSELPVGLAIRPAAR